MFEDTPEDPGFVPSFVGINPARRYKSVGVTVQEAGQIFVRLMSNPGEGLRMTTRFGARNTMNGLGYHPGIDFVGPRGIKSPIKPAMSGRVVGVWNSQKDRITNDFGIHTIIEHDIYGVKLYSIYAHLSEVNVGVGQVVSINSIIGLMGNTPLSDNGSVHLHFEVRTQLNVNLSDPTNAIVRGLDWWINNRKELLLNWVNLANRFGYS